MIGLVWGFAEPEPGHGPSTQSMTKTILQCFGHLSDRVLAWLFAVMVLMYAMEHVTFEFYQPYIKLLDLSWLESDYAALISGVVIAASMFGGTVGAAYSVRLFHAFGVRKLLLAAFLFQLSIVGGLSAVLALPVLGLVVFRNFPMAMIIAPVNATIAPRIGSHLRATYLSIQSLCQRLGFSGLLFALAASIDSRTGLEWGPLSQVLRESLFVGVVGVIILVLLSPASLERPPTIGKKR